GWRLACKGRYYRLPARSATAGAAARAFEAFRMVRALQAVLLGFVALLVVACARFGAPEQREVVLSPDRLNELLARRMSVDRKVLEVFHLRAGKPIAVLDPQGQRLRVDLDLSLMHPFSSRPLEGRAGISGGLAYDSGTRTV